jgi:hypothetical protein
MVAALVVMVLSRTEAANLKEVAGREDYDLGLQLLSPAGILTAGTGDACGVTIGSPKWQLRESHSLKQPQNRRRGMPNQHCMRDPTGEGVSRFCCNLERTI